MSNNGEAQSANDGAAMTQEKKPINYQKLISILKKPTRLRTQADIEFMLECVANIPFFAQYRETLSELVSLCCLHMKYEQMLQNDYVFHYGTVGTKFYIILQGDVDILIPKNPAAYDVQKPAAFCVAKLHSSDSFGELALINDKPRMATIRCANQCHFGVVEKSIFMELIHTVEKETLNKKIFYLLQMPLFQLVNREDLRRLYLHSVEYEYCRGQYVFHEGEGEATQHDFYVVKEGEFVIQKSTSSHKNIIEIQDQSNPAAPAVQVEKSNRQPAQKSPKNGFKNTSFQREVKGTQKPLQLLLLTSGQFFGEEDIITPAARSFSVQCNSDHAVLLKIDPLEFQESIWSLESARKYLQVVQQKKWQTIVQRIEHLQISKESGSLDFKQSPTTITAQDKPILSPQYEAVEQPPLTKKQTTFQLTSRNALTAYMVPSLKVLFRQNALKGDYKLKKTKIAGRPERNFLQELVTAKTYEQHKIMMKDFFDKQEQFERSNSPQQKGRFPQLLNPFVQKDHAANFSQRKALGQNLRSVQISSGTMQSLVNGFTDSQGEVQGDEEQEENEHQHSTQVVQAHNSNFLTHKRHKKISRQTASISPNQSFERYLSTKMQNQKKRSRREKSSRQAIPIKQQKSITALTQRAMQSGAALCTTASTLYRSTETFTQLFTATEADELSAKKILQATETNAAISDFEANYKKLFKNSSETPTCTTQSSTQQYKPIVPKNSVRRDTRGRPLAKRKSTANLVGANFGSPKVSNQSLTAGASSLMLNISISNQADSKMAILHTLSATNSSCVQAHSASTTAILSKAIPYNEKSVFSYQYPSMAEESNINSPSQQNLLYSSNIKNNKSVPSLSRDSIAYAQLCRYFSKKTHQTIKGV